MGAESADIAIPASPPDPCGSCGETLCLRFHRYSPTWRAAASLYSISQTEAATSVPDAPNHRNSTQLTMPSSQLMAVIG